MPAIITDKFRIHNSEQFHEAFSESSGNTMYLGIGRPQAFATSTRADSRTNNEGSDTSPVTPADNVNAQFYPFDDLLAAKKITSSDVTFAIPRRNGQLEQLTIFTDMITEKELQALQQIKQQIVVQQLYMTQVFMY